MPFANAITHPRIQPPMVLVDAPRQPPPDALELAKQRVRRWQTKAFAIGTRQALGMPTAYQLEEILLQGEPDVVFPFDRPRLFDRMERVGGPAIAKYCCGGLLPKTRRWIDKAVHLVPGAAEVVDEIVWRLADPQPLTHLEWVELGHRHMLTSIALRIEATPFTLRVPGRIEVCMVPCGLHGTRFGLARALLQLRMYEVQGDLIGYFLALLAAIERCRFPHPDHSFAFMQAECELHILDSFTRVHVLPAGIKHVHEDEGLRAAKLAWFHVKDQWLQRKARVDADV